MRFAEILISLVFICCIILLSIPGLNASNRDIIKESIPIAQSIHKNRQQGESCKELNMNLYVWLRSQGYNPYVQIGTLEGQGHLWLELHGAILDVTRPNTFGKIASEFNKIYVIDERLRVK